MLIRILFLAVCLAPSFTAVAADQLLLDFKILQAERKIEQGKIMVTDKKHVWSRGLKRTYVKIRCVENSTGKIHKSYSMVDLFSGVRVTHQLDSNQIKLSVVRTTVQPRLQEIRALEKNECKDLSPIVNTISQDYTLPLNIDTNHQQAFGDKMIFQMSIHRISD